MRAPLLSEHTSCTTTRPASSSRRATLAGYTRGPAGDLDEFVARLGGVDLCDGTAIAELATPHDDVWFATDAAAGRPRSSLTAGDAREPCGDFGDGAWRF